MENKVYVIEIDESIPLSEYEKELPLFSTEQREKVNRRKVELAKKLTIVSTAFVRSKACELLGIKNEDLCFGQNEYGKPYLVNDSCFHFNISHTKNRLAIGISETEIGVDIEKIRKFNPGIAERFFTPEEATYLKEHTTAEDFYRLWTKKEAYLKWQGTGLSAPLNSFNALEQKNIKTTLLGDYVISVCCEKDVLIDLFSSQYRATKKI